MVDAATVNKHALSVDEIVSDFEKKMIDTLQGPERNVIGNLTGAVEDFVTHKESSVISQKICQVIERRLNEVHVSKKLAHLYLMDSIIKNLKNSAYPKLFSANLVQSFTSVFRKGDERMRKKLFELRKSWADHFANSVLHALDTTVKEVDPAWPILAIPPEKEAEMRAEKKRTKPPDSPDSTTADSGSGRKRPAGQPVEDFMIDTVGDPKVEAKAARAGRQDVDMRRSWSQYKKSQNDQFSGDVDMRQFDTDSGVSEQQAQMTQLLRSTNVSNLSPERRQQLLICLKQLQNIMDPGEQAIAALVRSLEQQQQARGKEDAIPQHVDSVLDKLLSLSEQPAARRPLPEAGMRGLFRWRVQVPGMPEFPQIGCDPRLLTQLRDRFEASKNIQIDGELRQVVLDRVQPLLILFPSSSSSLSSSSSSCA